jgi:putative transposase
MNLTAKIKLRPIPEQHALLLKTLETANTACNDISRQVWETETFGQFSIHRLVYHDIRARYPLSAQMVVRAIAKVADAYKASKKVRREFGKRGAFPYDNRSLSFKTAEQTVSIWTLEGRQRMSYLCGNRQRELLEGKRGEADLCYIDGEFYLFVACEIETPESEDVTEFLGIDLGVKNVAVDSDGNVYSSGHLNGLRRRYAKLRARLQSKGTKSAKRLLKKRRRKEHRFGHDVNHCISKEIVERAKDTGRGIALEDLQGIRDRVTVRKAQRRQHHSWSFHDLRQKIAYKARLVGVPVVAVDPRNTSRTCPVCGCVDKRNRPNQSTFSCVRCSFSGLADHIAAHNIASRAAVNQPDVARLPLQAASAAVTSPLL